MHWLISSLRKKLAKLYKRVRGMVAQLVECWRGGCERSLTLTLDETTVKPVLNGHSIIVKAEVLKTNGSLKKVQSIAECSF